MQHYTQHHTVVRLTGVAVLPIAGLHAHVMPLVAGLDNPVQPRVLSG